MNLHSLSVFQLWGFCIWFILVYGKSVLIILDFCKYLHPSKTSFHTGGLNTNMARAANKKTSLCMATYPQRKATGNIQYFKHLHPTEWLTVCKNQKAVKTNLLTLLGLTFAMGTMLTGWRGGLVSPIDPLSAFTFSWRDSKKTTSVQLLPAVTCWQELL